VQLSLFDVSVPPPRLGREYVQTVCAQVRPKHPALLQERASVVVDGCGAPSDWVAALGLLLDPAEGQAELGDAVDVLTVDVDLTDRGEDSCRLEWTVNALLRDTQALRDLALAACPGPDRGRRAAIRRSVCEAWRWAGDPYAPLRLVPGIDWTPVSVTVERA
jgi:hypothetical protein